MDITTNDIQLTFLLIGIGLFLAVMTLYTLASRYRRKRNEQVERWLLEFLPLYRNMGFFSYYYDQTDLELADILTQLYTEEWGRRIRPKDACTDLDILALDDLRVWAEDLEADVGPGEQVYVGTLYRWADISQGVFHPTEIMERWEGEEGPVTVQFTLDGEKHSITPKYINDWMDIGTLLSSVNQLIAHTGRQFVCRSDGQSAVVFLVTPGEKERIERERGITLTELS